ncbi:hypothetical protein CkaCkLH20_09682 [Colletotrichum karsti]|uniref:Protein kinase domain-containing protein n=1 Tax=Colletotrichum karsti TaxID=1095194 RepID=A0A9P6LE65_9PEZI|nr:uncharacterized protein CkaCkLH20_09682 [Colletotrichum karsti]KAF9872819.1 hypothetical protein CkaCkLH20_09682 [Colletotrichum karsti]
MSETFIPLRSREIRRYLPGKLLKLYPYTPADPHGSNDYPENDLPVDLQPGWVRGFDPTNVFDPDIVLKVDQQLATGYDRQSQVTLCSFVKTPSQHDDDKHAPRRGKAYPTQVVAKSFDAALYSDFYGISHDQRADSDLSIEHAAYNHMYGRGLTGYPHLTPEYYGTYVAVFDLGVDYSGRRRYRCSGVVLMQYIPGISVENLCNRPNGTELAPPRMHPFKGASDDREVFLDDDFRKDVIRQFLDGAVRMLHVGIEHDSAEPRNLFVTMMNDDEDLDAPWVVIIDYTLTQVLRFTKEGREDPDDPVQGIEKLPLPPHPWERFSFTALGKFVGWYPFSRYYNLRTNKYEEKPIFAKEIVWCKQGRPVNWDEASEEQRKEFRQVPSFVYNKNGKKVVEAEKEFDAWLIDTFDPIVEGSEVGGNYSTFETLRRIEDADQKPETDQL